MKDYLRALDCMVVAALAMREGNLELASQMLDDASKDPSLERASMIVLAANKKAKKKAKKKVKSSVEGDQASECASDDVAEDAAELASGFETQDSGTVGKDLRVEGSKISAALIARTEARKAQEVAAAAAAKARILAAEAGEDEDDEEDGGEETASNEAYTAPEGPGKLDGEVNVVKMTTAPGATDLNKDNVGEELKDSVTASAKPGNSQAKRLQLVLANIAAVSAANRK